jgi:hypothetical protein
MWTANTLSPSTLTCPSKHWKHLFAHHNVKPKAEIIVQGIMIERLAMKRLPSLEYSKSQRLRRCFEHAVSMADGHDSVSQYDKTDYRTSSVMEGLDPGEPPSGTPRCGCGKAQRPHKGRLWRSEWVELPGQVCQLAHNQSSCRTI